APRPATYVVPPPTPVYALSLHDALPILWRLVDERIDAAHLPRIWAARAGARAAAWEAGAAPSIEGWLHIDVDATLTLDHSDNKVDRKSTRLNSSHVKISYAVFCLKKKNT